MLFLIVGASGVGKDSILDGVRLRLQRSEQFIFAKRTVTREKDLGGEDYDSVTEDRFQRNGSGWAVPHRLAGAWSTIRIAQAVARRVAGRQARLRQRVPCRPR